MREIKFRGYDRQSEKWCYGSLKAGLYGQWYIEFYINRSLQKYRVDEDSIGQYTGFKDKNGKEIYEGDIIEYEKHTNSHIYYNYPVRVCFDEELGAWVKKEIEKLEGDEDDGLPLHLICDRSKIIGNIYENKLKG